MLLNRDEIERRNLIENPRNDSFRTVSYDVTIGTIIGQDGKETNSLTLAPQQMVVVISSEILNLGKDKKVAGYAMPKTRLSNEGILALSTGIADPGYRGRVSSILINFGKVSHELKHYAPFLRFTFHEIDEPRQFVAAPTMPPEQYLLDRRNMALQLPRTFLNIPDVTQTVARQVTERQRNFLTNMVGVSAAIRVLAPRRIPSHM